MTRVGIGAGASASVNVRAQAGVKIGQIIKGMISCLTRVEIRDMLQELTDQGKMEEDSGPLICHSCRRGISSEDEICPYCGAVRGEEPQREDMDDEEEDHNSELPINRTRSGSDWDLDDRPAEMDLAMDFVEILSGRDFSMEEAEEGSEILASIFEMSPPATISEYQRIIHSNLEDFALKEKLLNQEVAKSILARFEELKNEEEKGQFACEIVIDKKPNEPWSVFVEDPFQKLKIKGRHGRVQMGNKKSTFYVSQDKFISLLENRAENLKEMGQELLRKRLEFFNASTPEEAEMILKTNALKQKDIADKIGISESTLSRWCSQGRVLVLTPHGPYELKTFFGRKAGTSKWKDLTMDGIQEIIKDIESMGLKKGEVEQMLKEQGIERAPRTRRFHSKQIRATEALVKD